MKGKCKYCETVLKDIANIRCDKCNISWNDGVEIGKMEIKNKLKEIFIALNNIANYDRT